MLFEFGKYTVDVDVEKTREFYLQAPMITEECDCQGCRNYEKWATSLSAEPKHTMERMGILLEKCPEVYAECPNEDGTLSYGGFYHLCGRIVRGDDVWKEVAENMRAFDANTEVAITENFHIAFTENISLLDKNFPRPAIQMEIVANIPFVLPERCAYNR